MSPKSPTKVRKVVFPVAGLGTRFLPATKVIPKEMLTVVDKPVIQYAVEEAIEAGIEHFVFVTGRGKNAIEDHFDLAFELEATLKARGKTAEIEILRATRPLYGAASFVRQQEPLGLSPIDGTPVYETQGGYLSDSALTGGESKKGLRISKLILGRRIDPDHIAQLLANGRTQLITGFLSKKKRPFDAFLLLDKKGKITFDFPPRKKKEKAEK